MMTYSGITSLIRLANKNNREFYKLHNISKHLISPGMEDNNQASRPQEEEKLSEKAKKLIDKADEFIEENVDKVMKSDAFTTVAESFDKAGDFIEEKIEDLRQGRIKEKIEELADKAEDQAEESVSKLKDLGKKAAGKAADALEDLAGNLRKKAGDDQKS